MWKNVTKIECNKKFKIEIWAMNLQLQKDNNSGLLYLSLNFILLMYINSKLRQSNTDDVLYKILNSKL